MSSTKSYEEKHTQECCNCRRLAKRPRREAGAGEAGAGEAGAGQPGAGVVSFDQPARAEP